MDELIGHEKMTRARFLAGAGLAAGAGALGAAAVSRRLPPGEWPGALAAAFRPEAREAPPSTTSVHHGELHSRTVPEPVPYAIVWPPGVRPGDPLPVCFALPARGGGPPVWFAEPLAEAVGDDDVKAFALAAVAGGESYWHPRASGEDRLAMLLDEFIPRCAERYRLGEHRRAIIGWSMGGYGALLAAETRPELFAAVVAVSPAVWSSYADMLRGPGDAFDGPADFARHDVIAHAGRLAGLRVRVDCGTEDRFWRDVVRLTAVLPEPASGGFSKGGHGGDYWRGAAPAQVEFIGRALEG
ncbi:MAG TPA: alpha/beta fold hydrolase [Thermoleophilia bacterium]|nr:alpha/beta fold hydrolase [Thermoleophilia bacterium]